MPIDSTRLEELQIVRRIRETVRRWWGVELSFTDARGFVLDHGKGIIIPPQNRICTACLGDREGLRRCYESIEKGLQKLSGGTELLGPCHTGLELIGAPHVARSEQLGPSRELLPPLLDALAELGRA